MTPDNIMDLNSLTARDKVEIMKLFLVEYFVYKSSKQTAFSKVAEIVATPGCGTSNHLGRGVYSFNYAKGANFCNSNDIQKIVTELCKEIIDKEFM